MLAPCFAWSYAYEKLTEVCSMSESIARLRKVGAVLSLAAILAACGGKHEGSDATEQAKQDHPTAVQLAKRGGGTVSEFPRYERGLADNIRYCKENDGVILWVSDVPGEEAVGCKIAEIGFVSHLSRRDDSGLEEMCTTAGGDVVGVATDKGSSFNIPACHIPGERVAG